MSQIILVVKVASIAVFLLMFLRGNRMVWGIGLLTVTSAILLDTFLSTFGRDEMLEELGFFFYIISGALFAGAAAWLWGILRPVSAASPHLPGANPERAGVAGRWPARPAAATGQAGTAFDRQMVYEQIRERFGPSDVADLIFDLGFNENDVFSFHQDMQQAILVVLDLAEQRGLGSQLALAVERILTPMRRSQLPRTEKLGEATPPNVLRHYMLANFTMADLEYLATELGLDWEMISGPGKQDKVRNLLLHSIRRNRLGELINLIQKGMAESNPSGD